MVKRYGISAATIAAGAAKVALNTMHRYASQRVASAKAEADQVGQTTTGTDSAVTQYKKRKPKKKTVKKWKRQSKKFIKQALKLVGGNSVVLNEQQTHTFITAQAVNVVTLGGKSWSVNGNQSTGSNDMRRIMGADDRLEKIVNNTKTLIGSARADVTYRNSGTVAQEVDMYTVLHYGDKHLAAYITELNLAETRTLLPPQSGVATGTDPTLEGNRGMTLFDYPLLSQMGNKIIKKQKFVVQPNGVITHTFSTRKNTWFTAQEIANSSTALNGGYAKPGFTKSIVFVTKPVVGFASANCGVIIGATRKYTYKIFQDNREFNVYNPA